MQIVESVNYLAEYFPLLLLVLSSWVLVYEVSQVLSLTVLHLNVKNLNPILLLILLILGRFPLLIDYFGLPFLVLFLLALLVLLFLFLGIPFINLVLILKVILLIFVLLVPLLTLPVAVAHVDLTLALKTTFTRLIFLIIVLVIIA